MDPHIVQWLAASRRIACVFTDRELSITGVWGDPTILGAEAAALIGCQLQDAVPELIGTEEVLAHLLAGELERYDLSKVNRDAGRSVPMYLNMTTLPRRAEDEVISGLVHIAEDVTESAVLEQHLVQHRNELQLLQDRLARQNLAITTANAELRHLDEIKTVFVSVAAHELRSPLTSILGYLEMLLDGDYGALAPQQVETLEIMRSSGRRLVMLTNDLLDAARIEAGRLELLLRPVDLTRLVVSALTEFKPQAAAHGQEMSLAASADLPLALCDPMRARQIITNLISNASKYTPENGHIRVGLSRAPEAGFLEIVVADDGVGIAAEDHARLFARFFRAGSANLWPASGAGLGLYITRSLVELHGGRIWLESELGHGSTFHVTLPAS